MCEIEYRVTERLLHSGNFGTVPVGLWEIPTVDLDLFSEKTLKIVRSGGIFPIFV